MYHRTLKQTCGVEWAQIRAARAQREHPPASGYAALAIREFMSSEGQRVRTGVRWYRVKQTIIRPALCAYLAHPWLTLALCA